MTATATARALHHLDQMAHAAKVSLTRHAKGRMLLTTMPSSSML